MNYYNYFTEIEETFVRRRGKNLMLSPLDWALIESWQEREVPLHIVLRGIEKVFDTIDKQPARKRSVKSLFYCKEEIEAQFAEWLEMQIGKNGNSANGDGLPAAGEVFSGEVFSDDAVGAHLAEARLGLEAALSAADGDLRETLARVVERLSALSRGEETPEKLEAALDALDALVDDALLSEPAAETARREIEKQLGTYQNKMDKASFEQTRRLMLLKKLREDAKIPRLSLFYL